MGHTLLLEVPENVYDVLTKTAEQVGRPRELLAVEWLVTTMNRQVYDPLEEFIGAFSSDVPNWADNHDHYLGGAIRETMSTKGTEG